MKELLILTVHEPWVGRFFEDFVVGDIYKHWPGRTISETDNTWFTLLTNNTHPLHFDAEYGKRTPFGKNLVNSCLTLAIATGMSVRDVSQNGVANLGWDEVKLVAPVFNGDTLYAQTEVLEKRISKSRAGVGIVSVKTTALNQHGEVVLTFRRQVMVPLAGGLGGEANE